MRPRWTSTSRLVPSKTEGHFYLYLDQEMTWPEYVRLLTHLRYPADRSEPGENERGRIPAAIIQDYEATR
jgi:hypothetical protein